MNKTFVLFFCLILFICCGESNIYREYECSFTFDTTLHPLPCHLTAILGNPGHYVKIETSTIQGIRHLKTIRNYDNESEDIPITTQKETQLKYALGANNCIIVGTSRYGNGLLAYEGQCANCLSELGGTRYPMTWQNNGTQLYCAKCKRTYDVDNGQVVNGTPGKQLYMYKASFEQGILRVWN